MTVALEEEHLVFAEVVRSFLADVDARGANRQMLELETDELPPFWADMAKQGWTGMHLPERFGGQGHGLLELAIVMEELGRAVAPGPFLSTVVASGVVAICGDDEQRQALLPRLADGSLIGAVGVHGSLHIAQGVMEGDAGPVLGGGRAGLLLLAAGDDLVMVEPGEDVTVETSPGLDPSRRVSSVTCHRRPVSGTALLPQARVVALRLLRTLASAEASGCAHACTDMATAYAKERVQFGRTIGTFQAVKHRCADMLVDAQLGTASAWEAARKAAEGDDFSAAAAAAVALPAAVRCAQGNIQVHGGIGYTWEHDAHLFLRRATSLLTLLEGDGQLFGAVTALRRAVTKPQSDVQLPPEADAYRAQVRLFHRHLEEVPPDQQHGELVRSGYLVPHFPKPYGRGAGPVEQLVIDEELGDLARPDLGIGMWVLPTLIQHGTPDQLERWISPSLEGGLRWCQLFSEPGAGSDAAAIQTKGSRVEGGWLVRGQKVWTSDAMRCNRGLATVRTDVTAQKHRGITMMAIDMEAEGVEVRPLRELTGETLFNEVFLDDVFVPDDDVVGDEGGGWKVTRATLGNERVTIGHGRGVHTFDAESLLSALDRYAPDDSGLAGQVGQALAEAYAMRALNLRDVERAIGGDGPGPEGNITKLLSAEHAQRVTELGLRIAGHRALLGTEPELLRDLLFTRCLTIAGGTSEIGRNQIGERLLGLPRDPLV
ncbi:MAG TPA: acyl-CoA dehydrogenase [Acidimicrobiales bacterium]|nr:acyl-CoA dehydrogenase [Acidimicrobiales bacterium]